MNLFYGVLIVAGVTAGAVAVMLLVRRRAPEGSYFADGDRASGVFGVLATGFSVLLGFIIFLAFTSYDQSRTGAETEALVVAQQVETAQLLPPTVVAARLTGAAGLLRALGRAPGVAANGERHARATGSTRGAFGCSRSSRASQPVDRRPSSPLTTSGSTRPRRARRPARDRIHGAEGVIPAPLWIVLFVISGGDLRLHALLRRQRRSAPMTQAHADGLGHGRDRRSCCSSWCSWTARSGPVSGRCEPTAMERSLRIVDQGLGALGVSGQGLRTPCDAAGRPQ